MQNPLTVQAGDSLKLITTPVIRFPITFNQMMSLMPAFKDKFIEMQRSITPNGVYCSAAAMQPTYSASVYDFFIVEGTQLVQVPVATLSSISTGIVAAEKAQRCEPMLLSKPACGDTWLTVPHINAICADVIRQVLSSYMAMSRPWMAGIIPFRTNWELKLEEEDLIIDLLCKSGLRLALEEIDHHPSRLISVTATEYGLSINVLCDIRVYLWMSDVEGKLLDE